MYESPWERTRDGNRWVLKSELHDTFVEASDGGGHPTEEDAALCKALLERFGDVHNRCLDYLAHHFTFSRRYHLLGCEILREPDRHRARIIVKYSNEDDGYMLFEVGLTSDFWAVTGLVKYW